jgi:type I restriction enzyme S subunit
MLRLENFDVGAANPTLNRNHVHKLKIIFPKKVDTQKRIAAILSAYDELIENNKRRGALLEKLAEEIYREWFVRLRFPGHENVHIVKGVPEGWERKGLSKLGTYLNGYAFEPSDWETEGIAIIKIKEMMNGVTNDTPRNSGEDVPSKYHFDDGAIIFSWSGTLLALIWDQGPGLLNQHLFKVDPTAETPKSFLYLSIKFSIPIFESLTTGATMQHIKRKELDFVKVNIPPPSLLSQFDEMVRPILEQKVSLTKTIRRLTTTRNLLLPRLISGNLSVENLDIQFPSGMAEELNDRIAAAADA